MVKVVEGWCRGSMMSSETFGEASVSSMNTFNSFGKQQDGPITPNELTMRSTLGLQLRNGVRTASQRRIGAPCMFRRWTSTEARQWSTPLAKQLSEAITVYQNTLKHLRTMLRLVLGHRPDPPCDVYAYVLDGRPRRILYLRT